MPEDKPRPKEKDYVQITAYEPEVNKEDAETLRRFRRFAVDYKNFTKALQALLDIADAH